MSQKKIKPLQASLLASVCGQIALMLGAGMTLYDGLEILSNGDSESEHAWIYETLLKGVNETGSLYDAIKDDERFPVYMREMTDVGERTGHLEEVMNGLMEYYQREDRLRAAAVSAITYPVVLGVMLVLIILIMLWKVLPVFRRVLSGIGVDASNSSLMQIGATLGWVVLAVVAVLVIAAIIPALLMKTKKRDAVMRLLRKCFPAIGKLSLKLSTSRVASVISMMLSSGFPMEDAVERTQMVLTDTEAKKRMTILKKRLENGDMFADALDESKLFEDLHARMIRIGVAAGREDQVMQKLSNIYVEEVEDGISGLVSIIEPTLVAVLSVVIGAILLSVMLPMAGILTSLI